MFKLQQVLISQQAVDDVFRSLPTKNKWYKYNDNYVLRVFM